MAAGTRSEMSDYERAAWQELVAEADKQYSQSHRFDDWAQGIKARAGEAVSKVRGTVERVPLADAALDAADAALTQAMEGLHGVLVDRGLNSVTPAGVFATFATEDPAGAPVCCYDDVRRLDLRLCDASVPRRKDRYVALAIAQGAASSLAVSGAVASATVTGGTTAAVAVSAIVADVTAVMVGMGRIVALVAAHYGYDVRDPAEESFAAGVIGYANATGPTEAAASLASLSRLTQQMQRSDTWRQLEQPQLTNAAQRMFASLGFKLARRKLGQAVPVVGAVINGGLNARIAAKTFDRAQQAYRLRFLTEKHGLDAARWAPRAADAQPAGIPLIDELIDAELARKTTGKSTDG